MSAMAVAMESDGRGVRRTIGYRRMDIDSVRVMRVLSGEPLPLTRGERLVVVEALSRRGWNDKHIARFLGGLDPNQVWRDRVVLGLSSPYRPGNLL